MTTNYIRVRKQGARKLYNLDVPVTMVGHKMMPFGQWAVGYTAQKSDIDNREEGHTFDTLVNNHSFYNTDYEQGYYAAFYVLASLARKHHVPEHVSPFDN